MALIKHHLIFQNVFAYNISNDNNLDFLKILFILVSNSMYRYFIITLWFEFHIVLFYLINNLINRYFFFVLLISFHENIICFGKQSYTQIHYFDIFSRVELFWQNQCIVAFLTSIWQHKITNVKLILQSQRIVSECNMYMLCKHVFN